MTWTYEGIQKRLAPELVFGTLMPVSEEVWTSRIELTFPSRFNSLREFYEWYGSLTGKGASAYI